MTKIYRNSLAILVILFSAALLLNSCNQKLNDTQAEHEPEEKMDKYDGIEQAMAFEMERTRDLVTGKVPYDKLWLAIQQTEAAKNSGSNVINALSWIERGPDGDFSVGGNPRPNNDQTAGRIRAAMVDSLDATHRTVWVGGVDGGLWKTTNITASPANWILVNDFLSNLAVSAICQDPRPGSQNIMYFCTGESFRNADGVRGVGAFKSTDAGVTWNYLPSTSSFTLCSRMLCDYQGNVYLATRNTGLRRSTDGGTTWTDITPTGVNASICDLEITSTAGPARLHMTTGIGTTQTYRYTDIPSTVTSGSGWNAPTTPFPSYNERCEMAVMGNVLYACPVNNATNNVPTIYRSTDGGDNWTATATQPGGGTWASGQGWYSLSAGINPANTNEFICGGLDCWKTSNAGASWTKISTWAAASGQYVHADQHNIQWWDGGNKLMFACDGGIHFTTDGGTTIRDRNKGLRLKQFYSVAMHPTAPNHFIAGAQDNGVHRMNHPGLDSSQEVVGGDGCYVAIDQNQPQYQYGSYVYNVYRRSTNGGLTWSTPINNQSTGRFVNPWDYDNNTNIIYACNNAGTFLRWNDPQTGASTDVVSVSGFNGQNVSAVHASPYTTHRVYFGTGNGTITMVDNANTGTSMTGIIINGGSGMPAGYVNCIVTGSDDQHLIATFTNYGVQNVWLSTNGGTTWTACDGNLPDMPVRWALFHPDDDNKAFIATETGVWETDLLSGAATVWSPNTTFPNCRTDMIKYRTSDRTIAAGTHGRGIWSAVVPTASCTPPSVPTQPNNATTCAGGNVSYTIVAGGTSPFTYQWQVSTTGCGGSFSNISNGGVYSGATSATLNITGATAGMNGYAYKCVVTGCAAPNATSNCATLTVNAATSISSQPANVTVCAPAATSFSVTASGSSLTYQWQLSTDGGVTWNNLSNVAPYSNVTTSTLNISPTAIGLNGNQYRCVVNSTCSPLNSNAAVLTVNAAPAITSNPSNTSVCAGNAASFSVIASGGSLTYQWQESTNGGGTWNNLANGAPYSNVTTATLTINPTVIGMNNYQYRCVVNGSCPGTATSNAGILTVGTALSITSQPVSQTVCAGANVNFSITISGTASGYQWQESTNGGGTWNNITNGGIYSGATTTTLSLTGVLGSMNNYQYRCVVSGSCPSINSNAAILTVNTAPVVTAQPGNNTVYTGQPATFSITASGNGLTYQWQVSVAGCAGPWTNLTNGAPYSGVTTATLTINPTSVAMNGYGYRCVVSGTCAPAANSNCGLLTVNTPVTITSHPSNSTACAGANTSFSVTATGTTPAYQWQESVNGGVTWTDISNGGIYGGATTNTLSLTGITAGMNNYQYRCVVSGAPPGGSVNSNPAVLTVNTAPVITTQPVSGTAICAGQNTSYGVIASGTGLGYQWQLSTDGGSTYSNLSNGGVYSGVTTATVNITGATIGMNNYKYRCVVSGTCSPSATSSASTLTVYTAILITASPANAIQCATGSTSFSVGVSGSSPSYQWQESANGGVTWTNILNGGIYSGATTSTLTLTGLLASMNNYQYRCIVGGAAPCASVNSAAATLTVSPRPVVTLSASPYTRLRPGLPSSNPTMVVTTLTASVVPNAGTITWSWTRNGTPLPVTTNTTTADLNSLGIYTVLATLGSCTSEPVSVTIGDSASTDLYIYPSPNDGRFTVTYYSPGASTSSTTEQTIVIYNNLGQRVYNIKFPVSQPYQLHAIDLRRNGAGIYFVNLLEANGNVIGAGKVTVK